MTLGMLLLAYCKAAKELQGWREWLLLQMLRDASIAAHLHVRSTLCSTKYGAHYEGRAPGGSCAVSGGKSLCGQLCLLQTKEQA